MSVNRCSAAFGLIFSALGVIPIIGPEILPFPTNGSHLHRRAAQMHLAEDHRDIGSEHWQHYEGIIKKSAVTIGSSGTLLTLLLFCSAVTAQTIKVNGLITGRHGASMKSQTSTGPKLVVVLTDDTQVSQFQGMFKARHKQMSMASLIPGLQVQVQVQVEGSYDPHNQLIASSVKFKGNDLEDAQTIQAGMQPAKEQIQQSQEEFPKYGFEITRP
jgi:hypothetical protein